MKNRKTVVVAFLLCAVMLLGVGYAALTDTLDITGSADVNQSAAEEAFNEDIYFSAAVANETGNTASVNADNNDKASFTAATLKGQGDKVTFTFTIKNDGDVAAEVRCIRPSQRGKEEKQARLFRLCISVNRPAHKRGVYV